VKAILSTLCALALFAANLAAAEQAVAKPAGIGPSFKGPIGLQMYSLRFFAPTNAEAKLDKTRDLGFTAIEGGAPGRMAPDDYLKALAARGLKLVSTGADYNRLKTNPDAVVEQARKLGAKYVMCAWIPHDKGHFSEKNAREAIEVFNNVGAKLKAVGITFTYHCHGFEFQPFGDGTLFDLMMTETKPEIVSFQMDVFWAAQGGADPTKLLEKYGSRFKTMHVKDLRKGAAKNLTGGAPDEDSVAIGEGEINWPAVLKAAQRAGVEYYFIEDEAKEAVDQIPRSLRYLETLRW
jgi:sugar phosphate isomerase/epimerase